MDSDAATIDALESRCVCSVAILSRPDHVVVVVEENHSYSEILKSTSAPYIHSLAAAGAVFTNAHGVTHPSQPNYLAMFAGSSESVIDDSTPPSFSSNNLWRELHRAGKSFVGYAEDLPKVGYAGNDSGEYARRHSPWVNFSDVPVVDNQPFSSFPSDFRKLPTVSFVIPNLLHDMHDGSVHTGDRWLKSNLGAYATWAQTHNSLLIVTWDEDDGSANNHTPLLMVGQMVRPGTYGQRVDHFNTLRTIEDMYGLKPMGNTTTASPIDQIWL